MTKQRLMEIVAEIRFRDWEFRVGDMGDGFMLQVSFQAPDTNTGVMCWQHGRKFYLSRYAIEDEVVKAAWLAVELALRHEAMEEFKYFGVAPFHPHTDVLALVDVQTRKEHVRRNPVANRYEVPND